MFAWASLFLRLFDGVLCTLGNDATGGTPVFCTLGTGGGAATCLRGVSIGVLLVYADGELEE